jgi:rubredoxin
MDTITEQDVLKFVADSIPRAYWRPVITHYQGDLSPLIAMGKERAELHILSVYAEASGDKLCERCAGTGNYGHYGVCFDCGGRRIVPAVKPSIEDITEYNL